MTSGPDPVAIPDPTTEHGHPVEHVANLLRNIDAVHTEMRPAGQSEGGVEHGPVLGDVDVLAGEHGVPALQHAPLASQLHERVHDLPRHSLLAEVDTKSGSLEGPCRATVRLVPEQLA